MNAINVNIYEDMIGQVIERYELVDHDQELILYTKDKSFQFLHHQDCCESVSIESIVGELDDLVGVPLTMAEVVSHSGDNGEYDGQETQWTFYKFATVKGYVDVRWFGSSNGYYSTGVSRVVHDLVTGERLED